MPLASGSWDNLITQKEQAMSRMQWLGVGALLATGLLCYV